MVSAKNIWDFFSLVSDRDQFQLGTLSHLINARASGYCDLPSFPGVAPDPSVRNLKEESPSTKKAPAWIKPAKSKEKKSFYSDDEEETSSEGESESDSGSDSESESGEESSDSSSSGSDSEEEDDSSEETEDETESKKTKRRDERKNETTSSRGSSSSSSSLVSEDDSSASDSEDDSGKASTPKPAEKEHPPPQKSNLDLLLDLDTVPLSIETPVLTPSLGGLLTPTVPQADAPSPPPGSSVKRASPAFVPTATAEVLNRLSGNGLSVHVRFTRSVHLYSPSMTSLELTFRNNGAEELRDVCVGSKRLSAGMAMHDFALMPAIAPGASLHGTIGVDFNDSITPANFDIVAAGTSFPVSITPSIGELIHPVTMSEADFNHHQVIPLFVRLSWRQ